MVNVGFVVIHQKSTGVCFSFDTSLKLCCMFIKHLTIFIDVFFLSCLSSSQLKYQIDCFTEMCIIHSVLNPVPHLLSTLLKLESN
jgi:hypothetical protein